MHTTRIAFARFALVPLSAVLLSPPAQSQTVHSQTTTTPPQIAGCNIFPADHVWNTPIDQLPVHPNSTALVNAVGLNTYVHPDFGSGLYAGGPIGIPFITVPGTQAKLPATFTYASESDKGPYPIPLTAPIEGGAQSTGDRHVLAIDTTNCILYELYAAYPQPTPTPSWQAGSGAIFDLKGYTLRPASWTSADAAGLPILPGLVRYDEVAAGEIRHALRFTAPHTLNQFVWPARHEASSLTGTQYPPMGQRFRLKASFDVSTFPPDVQVILNAMKKYGIILADNGTSWFISGAPDDRWNNDTLHQLQKVFGYDMEAVDGTALMISPNSGQARQPGATPPPVITITVTPPTATLAPGATKQFTAQLSSGSQQVSWSTSAGTIDQTGRFIAPATTGTITVTATSVANPSLKATATVTLTRRRK